MKAIILAAGMGTRLGRYTKNLPKGMLEVGGKPLIQRQIEILRTIGLDDIIIVTGFQSSAINFPGVRYYHNPDYAGTNMVETLLCARPEFDTDILVVYSDILFSPHHVRKIASSTADVAVLVDGSWRDYWTKRYGTTETDLESLSINADGEIVEIGKPLQNSAGIDFRYIGMNKFSPAGMQQALALYDEKCRQASAWKQSGKPFRQGYFTDLLHEMILSGNSVKAVTVNKGWLELDTEDDYEHAAKLIGMADTGISLSLEESEEMEPIHRLLNHSFADYCSPHFPQKHLNGRESFLEEFTREKLELSSRLPNDGQKIDVHVLLRTCLPKTNRTQPRDKFETLTFMADTIEHFLSHESFTAHQNKIVNLLQKKFAVFHRIFSIYTPQFQKIDSTYQATEIYALLAILLLIRFNKTNNFNDMNSALCLNDLLAKSKWLIKPTHRRLIYCAILIELQTINSLYNG